MINTRRKSLKKTDVIIIGAGAAGMMCAMQASRRGRSVMIIDHMQKIGEKIRISGGGKCNFTNLHCSANNFISQNQHFCKSALKRFNPRDFMQMLREHEISYHEKRHDFDADDSSKGQMFCNGPAQNIVDMLQFNIDNAAGKFQLGTKVKDIKKDGAEFIVNTDRGDFTCDNLVIASGGLSIPKIGASNFGYEIAKKFGLNIIPPRAGLVPLTFDEELLARTKELSGLSLNASVSCDDKTFREGLLFTHRGLSGPSILQISSYWKEGQEILVNLAPDMDVFEALKTARKNQPKQMLRSVLSGIIPSRIAVMVVELSGNDKRIADLSDKRLRAVSDFISSWKVKPKGSEGYRTAEVTIGGVDTNEISSKTFETKEVEGLYFIGEVLDVTGHLGGHNFQWAWSSGYCAGQVV